MRISSKCSLKIRATPLTKKSGRATMSLANGITVKDSSAGVNGKNGKETERLKGPTEDMPNRPSSSGECTKTV